jgi:8-oxo-dGTP pyrophosphatase MutT (NUDIX family)
VSAAGHVSAGESIIAAAQRETFQELGVKAAAEELHRLCTVQTTSVQHNGSFIDNEFSEVFIMRKDLDIRDLALEQSEVAGALFLPRAALDRLARQGDRAFAPHPEEYTMLFDHLSK